jgi:hypothetical protein
MGSAIALATDRKVKHPGARGRVTILDAVINICLAFTLFGLAGGMAFEVNGFARGLCVVAAAAGGAAAFITAVGNAADRALFRRHARELHEWSRPEEGNGP